MEIVTILPSWAWIIVSSIFFAFGEFLSKKFALSPGWMLFISFIVIDIISAAAWMPAIFEKSQLSITGVIWAITSLIATVLIGILAFGEKLTLTQTIGVAAGLVCVVLLSK